MYSPSAFSLLSRRLALCSLALAVAVAVGCGGSKGSKDSVTGKVTMNNQAVNGTIEFTFSDGKMIASPLAPDGGYAILGPPKGDAKVAVKGSGGSASMGPKGAEGPKMDMASAAGGGVQPPAKYGKAETSGLTYTVKGGEEKKDFELAP